MELGVFLPEAIAKDAINPRIKWDGAPRLNRQEMRGIEADPESGTLMVHVDVHWYKMSRRRFERMLMAIGVHAREAKEMADVARANGIQYNEAFDVACKLALKQLAEEQQAEEAQEEADE